MPRPASQAAVWKPTMAKSQPVSKASTGRNRLLAATPGKASQRGPAVKRKPTMNSGMKPMDITSPCATGGATAQGNATPP